MRSTNAPLALLALLLASPPAPAQEAEVGRALARYEEFRPSSEDLVMYALDWAPDYETALERAGREDRPILLVRIHAQYGDLFSGHC